MQLGHQHFQVWINTGVFALTIMGAFLCDFLRRKNQQLRELAVELAVRNQESERREQILLARAAPTPQPSALEDASAVPASTVSEPETEPSAVTQDAPRQAVRAARPARRKNHRDRTQALSPDTAASIERGLQMAADPRLAAKIKKLVVNPQIAKPQAWQETGALPASDLVAELFERHAAKSEAVHARKPASACGAKPAIIPEKQIEEKQIASVAIETVTLAASSPNAPILSSITQSAHSSKGSKKNWSALLSRQTGGTAPTHERLDAMVAAPAKPTVAECAVPAGFYDGHVLSQILRSNRPVSGLIVSIGVSGGVSGQVSGEARASVADLMRSLLGPTDFGCQSGEEEFLLIYTRERGASAQRRLSSIAQQLWSFQLCALGQFEILFSWGGMEVSGESVESAIASAKDRMIETKRGREAAVGSSPGQMRAA